MPTDINPILDELSALNIPDDAIPAVRLAVLAAYQAGLKAER